ncbi:MAG: methylenetetrahydrofolate reductase [Proteobacteria bacterium]|nr:methylenetetrahydrofolate reductase [Desulfobacteraceae bacterium]MBU3980416.1 methylenetetrahydrofolate reductase [Pseudomonadota bacterium]MBU4013237.1 methylenetetrahydrofolate reductase [Pseudomonadota bacterium]MBU4067872.1 methylenetetrahydrofolate reductase [Pseudomonadota bacterium]MBU4101481.1 methylenetetrahydrofolate reductase [Pseudomonadota bacterium]
MKSGSNLEKILSSGQFAVTAECGPPKGTSVKVIQRKGELLKFHCDALNVTDNQTAIVRMSSLSGCVLLKQVNVEPVMQMVVRDRNRLAIQSDILGAVALGIRNVLCLSGDHQKFGNHPTAKGVYDIDSMQLIQTLKKMRDEKKFLSGDDISGEVPLFLGAAANPFADPFEFRVTRLAKKIKAGADFIQTQAIFDVPKFIRWMEMVRDRGLDQKVHILAGVIPVKSVGMARYMRNNVSGLSVPKELVDRMADAKDAKEEGVKICLETIELLKEIDGIHGVHIMAVAWEDIVPEIVEKAGLMPRPVI